MRIAVANWTAREVGGIETYLKRLLPALAQKGHELLVVAEGDVPPSRASIVPPGVQLLCLDQVGVDAALKTVSDWRPSVIYTNYLGSTDVEEKLQSLAPSVASVHQYATCISGHKTFLVPSAVPCSRSFGPGCLAHYYPRRCGGLNPVTMLRLYRDAGRRLAVLRTYGAVIAHSRYVAREYARHGIHAEVVYCPVRESSPCVDSGAGATTTGPLLFVGRMDRIKGGRELLAALPIASRLLNRDLELTLIGDGPDRPAWESLSRRLPPTVRSTFRGWIPHQAVTLEYPSASLLVVPSVWPEPFGMVGLEAAMHGVPSAAFAVGGIVEWLVDGANGALAPSNPPTAEGLAEAIARCLAGGERYRALRDGSRKAYRDFAKRNAADEVLGVLARVAA